MTKEVALIIVAILLFVLIPIVPNMVRLRVKFLRWLKWNKIADWHEKHITVLTPILRSVLVVIGVILLGVVII